MARPDGRKRGISTVAASLFALGLGAALVWFGVQMAGFGIYAVGEGELFLGVVALLFGVVLVGAPLAVVANQLLALRRRR